MRNILALVGLAVVTFVAVGWYLDWYKVSTVPGASGHREVTIATKGPKINGDLGKGGAKRGGVLQGGDKKGEGAVQTVTPADPVPSPMPPGMPAIPVTVPPPAPAAPPVSSSEGQSIVPQRVH